MKPVSTRLTLPLLASLALSFSANAAEPARPCREDMQRLCADSIGDRQQMRTCMQANFNEFSQACQTKLFERAQRRQLEGDGQKKPVEEPTEAPVT